MKFPATYWLGYLFTILGFGVAMWGLWMPPTSLALGPIFARFFFAIVFLIAGAGCFYHAIPRIKGKGR